jgi:hypothetical protein
MASKRVLCADCGKRHPVSHLKKEIFGRSEIGEPAEYSRVMKGKALEAAPSQRVIYMNDVPHKLEAGHYDCDLCGGKIKPGDNVTCLTIWNERQATPGVWEIQYMIPERE